MLRDLGARERPMALVVGDGYGVTQGGIEASAVGYELEVVVEGSLKEEAMGGERVAKKAVSEN